MCSTGRSGARARGAPRLPESGRLPKSGRLDLERLVATGESPQAGESPVVLAPDVGLDVQLPLVHLVDVQTARLAAAVGARLAEPWGDRDRRTPQAAGRDLELVPLGDGCLVDVTGEDQLGAGVDERGENVAAPGDRLLPRAPRGPDQVVVEHHDAKCVTGRAGE